MANESIRNDFIEGTYDIFTTLFSEGIEGEGIELYLLSDEVTANIYGEVKYKKYKQPITLVSHARINARHDVQYVEEMKYQWYFVVPLKTLQENDIDVSSEGLKVLKKGMIKFKDTFYCVDEVLPRVYLEDVFLFYHFICVEETNVTSLLLEEPKVEEEPPKEPSEDLPSGDDDSLSDGDSVEGGING